MRAWSIAVLLVACASEAPTPRAAAPVSSASSTPAPVASASSSAAPSASVAAATLASASATASTQSDDNTPPEEPIGPGLGFGLGLIDRCVAGFPGLGVDTGLAPRDLRGEVESANGGLTLDMVRAKVCAAFYGKPHECFVAAKSTLGDKPTTASITFEIDKTGSVASAKLEKSDADAKLSACLVDALKGVSFAAAKAKTTVKYRFDVPAKGPPTGKISEGAVVVSAGLMRDIVRRIVRVRFSALRACYEKVIKTNPKLEGTVTVSFAIQPNGTIKDLKTTGSLTDAAVVGCVTKNFLSMAFPEPEKKATVNVTYPLTYTIAP